MAGARLPGNKAACSMSTPNHASRLPTPPHPTHSHSYSHSHCPPLSSLLVIWQEVASAMSTRFWNRG